VVILWQLGRADVALPIVLLLGTLAILRWRYRVQRAFLELDARQTPVRRKLEYLRSLLIERSPAAEVRLFGLPDHLIEAWRGLNEGLLRQISEARLGNLRRELPRSLFPVAIYGLVILTLLHAAARGAVSPGAFVALLYAAQQYQDQLRPTTIRVEAVLKLLHELGYLQEFLSLEGEETQCPVPSARCSVENDRLSPGTGHRALGAKRQTASASRGSASPIRAAARPSSRASICGFGRGSGSPSSGRTARARAPW
jgi:hypothetical protein